MRKWKKIYENYFKIYIKFTKTKNRKNGGKLKNERKLFKYGGKVKKCGKIIQKWRERKKREIIKKTDIKFAITKNKTKK